MQRPPTIDMFSTALYSTWILVEEYGLLIDAGDGVSAMLAQRTGKVHHVFVTHADRDHVTGLLQLVQLRPRPNDPPSIHYPKDCGSFPALAEFSRKFDPQIQTPPDWIGVEDGDRISLGKNRFIIAIRNEHILVADGVAKSLSYLLVEERRRLKPEFRQLPQTEIARLSAEQGQEAITETFDHQLVGFSGDTPGGDYEHWREVDVLIHEATFLSATDDDYEKPVHSALGDVLKMAADVKPKRLILAHFSTRYDQDEVMSAVAKGIEAAAIKFPVHVVGPGELVFDVLRQSPINSS
ncbi:MAG: MBL fold metallo-hydrolase [Verrucomicrobiota bacterium]